MTKPIPDVRVGDVWLDLATTKAFRVEYVNERAVVGKQDRTGRDVIVSRFRMKPTPKGYRLIERDGVRVGDVRAVGKASTIKVLRFEADGAHCEGATTTEWFLFDHLGALPLVERDGKPVKQADYVNFGDIARGRLHEQAQYASRAIDGRHGYPNLGKGLRFRGRPTDYHSVEIHRDDVNEFCRRWAEHFGSRP